MTEQNTTNQESSQQKFKVKEALSNDELKSILSGWLQALEEETDFKFDIKGNKGVIPKWALLANTTKGEYESKKGEFEFELELKWRDQEETTSKQ